MIYAITSCGTNKLINEDAVLVGNTIVDTHVENIKLEDRWVICIADGVGGNAGGDLASRFVVNHLRNQLGDVNSLEELRGSLVNINEQLLAYANGQAACKEMATTLTGVYCLDDNRYLFHIGNTRAYALQGKYLKQISEDHTVKEWLLRQGQFEEAENCNASEITNCFGGGKDRLLSKLIVSPMENYRKLLLTSDGIHDYVDIETMEDVVGSGLPGIEMCETIIQAARNNGSSDDASVVLIMEE